MVVKSDTSACRALSVIGGETATEVRVDDGDDVHRLSVNTNRTASGKKNLTYNRLSHQRVCRIVEHAYLRVGSESRQNAHHAARASQLSSQEDCQLMICARCLIA
jgi:hypothetical protein